jgi:hypothetical protein
MTKFLSSVLLASVVASTFGFTPAYPRSGNSVPFFAKVVEKDMVKADEGSFASADSIVMDESVTESKPKAVKKKPAAKGHGKEGILSPLVTSVKKVIGDESLNKVRGKAIGLHSKVIGGFVDTAETEFGDRVLRALFDLADKDKSGTIEEEELAVALRALGFSLKDNQIKGIFERGDLDANGALDFEEWRKEAPKTLRTNLIKLAKKNGGELGFLS